MNNDTVLTPTESIMKQPLEILKENNTVTNNFTKISMKYSPRPNAICPFCLPNFGQDITNSISLQ